MHQWKNCGPVSSQNTYFLIISLSMTHCRILYQPLHIFGTGVCKIGHLDHINVKNMELAWLGWLHLEVDITNSILKPTKGQVQPLGCLIRLLQHLVRRTQKLKGVGHCSRHWQIFTSLFVTSAVTHYHNLTGMQGLYKSESTSQLLFALLWMSHADQLVCLAWWPLSILGLAVLSCLPCNMWTPWMPRLPGLAHQDLSEWPAIALWVAQIGGHLWLLDFWFI